MKKLTLIVCSLLATASFALAGSGTYSNNKDTVTATSSDDLYRAGEFQLDVFGATAHKYEGNGSSSKDKNDRRWNNRPGYNRNQRSGGDGVIVGGGVGANYFFTRNFGIGADGYVLDSNKPTGQVAGTLIARYPIGNSHFAPYAVVGGGAVFNGIHSHGTKALVKGGLGLEYRFTPNIGVMTDYTYNIVDGSHNNYGLARVGMRFAF